MKNFIRSCLMLVLLTPCTHATGQMTVMIPAYEMTCAPSNPVIGPDGKPHEYAPYQVAWDGQNRMLIGLAGTDVAHNSAVHVKRVSEKIALLKSGEGANAYTVRLDFQQGSAAYDYGRMDKCMVTRGDTSPPNQAIEDSSVFFERKTKSGWLVNGGFDDTNIACYATDLKLVVIETFSNDGTFTVLFEEPNAIPDNGKVALVFWSSKGVARTYWADYEVIERNKIATVRMKLDIRKFAPILGEHARLTVSFDGDNKTVNFSLKGIRDAFLLIRDCIGVALNLDKLRTNH